MPPIWGPELDARLLMGAVNASNIKLSADDWDAVAENVGQGVRGSACSRRFSRVIKKKYAGSGDGEKSSRKRARITQTAGSTPESADDEPRAKRSRGRDRKLGTSRANETAYDADVEQAQDGGGTPSSSAMSFEKAEEEEEEEGEEATDAKAVEQEEATDGKAVEQGWEAEVVLTMGRQPLGGGVNGAAASSNPATSTIAHNSIKSSAAEMTKDAEVDQKSGEELAGGAVQFASREVMTSDVAEGAAESGTVEGATKDETCGSVEATDPADV